MSKGVCFVVMPFKKKAAEDELYIFGIKEPLLALEYDCFRLDELNYFSELIDNELEEAIKEASFVVADLTNSNPNCFYELGYARALQKRVILVAKNGTTLPFDASHLRCHFYDSSIDLRDYIVNVVTSDEKSRIFRKVTPLDLALDSIRDALHSYLNSGRIGNVWIYNGHVVAVEIHFPNIGHAAIDIDFSFYKDPNYRTMQVRFVLRGNEDVENRSNMLYETISGLTDELNSILPLTDGIHKNDKGSHIGWDFRSPLENASDWTSDSVAQFCRKIVRFFSSKLSFRGS